MSQEIKEINIKELILWTENPRDPVDTNSNDQDIANRAISTDGRSKWSLQKLFNKMGPRFDQSEIPTVAYVDDKPVVFDGNRRVLIGKIIHEYVKVKKPMNFSNFDFPETIPCNVCDSETALQHVDRKHAGNGSWGPLERDIFKHTHMNKKKSSFLILDKETNIISNNPKLNKRFVKDEIFDNTNLHKLGFSTQNGRLETNYSQPEQAMQVLKKIQELVEDEEISTRNNRGKIFTLLQNDKNIKKILSNQSDEFRPFSTDRLSDQDNRRKTPISRKKEHNLFGSKELQLRSGIVNNLYSDISNLYQERKKRGYSEDFPRIIRMGLRLIVEIATNDNHEQDIEAYLKHYFEDAKKKLSQDEKTTLNSQAVTTQKEIVKLLHHGAHGYTTNNNLEQTVALSLIIGKILEISHEKNQK